MFKIKVIHTTEDCNNDFLEKLNLIIQNQNKIMTDLASISLKFDELTTTIAEERAQANAKLDELQTTINDLRTNVQQGGTDEERTALFNKIDGQIAEVKAIIPDATN